MRSLYFLSKDFCSFNGWLEMKPNDDLNMVWSEFQENTIKYLSYMRNNHDFCDVTLAGDDLELLPAHKVIISAGSDFFETIIRKTGGHPVLYLRGVSKGDLEVILAFLYTGETRVEKLRQDSFLALARDLGVRGFAQKGYKTDGTRAKV